MEFSSQPNADAAAPLAVNTRRDAPIHDSHGGL